MSKKGFFLLTLTIMTATVNASELLQLRARNVPAHCEFVFRVDSDLEVTLESADRPLVLFGSYRDAYDADRRGLESFRVPLESIGLNRHRVEWTLASFEANQRKLYREVDFWIEGLDRDDRPRRWPASDTEQMTTSFGREFGDGCSTQRETSPWLPRKLSVEPLP